MGDKHKQKSKLLDGVPLDALCQCGRNMKLVTPEVCPLHGVIPPFEGDGLCHCCSTCRGKCAEEV